MFVSIQGLIDFRESLERSFRSCFELPENFYALDLSPGERNGFISVYQYNIDRNLTTPTDEFWEATGIASILVASEDRVKCDNLSFIEAVLASDRVARMRNSIDNGGLVYDLEFGGNGVSTSISQFRASPHYWNATISFDVIIRYYTRKNLKGELLNENRAS